jgi:hypothetical protein
MKKRGQGITHVSNLFLKYQQILKAPEATVTSSFIEAVDACLNIKINKDQCSYTVANKTLTLHTSGVVKSEILLHKRCIRKKIAEILGEKNIPKEIL